MLPQSQPPRLLRFGTFEVDVPAGELRKNGLKLKMQEQPFRVLCMLLEHPGEVVTREQLRSRLWPADTFVDFDHGLNAAVKRLRDAMGDDPDNPRFVETVPRRGYRFLATVSMPKSERAIFRLPSGAIFVSLGLFARDALYRPPARIQSAHENRSANDLSRCRRPACVF